MAEAQERRRPSGRPYKSRLRRCDDPKRVALKCAWEDVGDGDCSRCHTGRRLYSPQARPDLRVCAPCTQVYACASMPNHERVSPELLEFGAEDDGDGVDEEERAA